MNEERIHQMALELIPGLGGKGIKHLISYCGNASEVFRAPKSKLLKIPGVGQKLVDTIAKNTSLEEAQEILLKAEKMGSSVLHYTDQEFPKRLKQLPDSPTLLFFKGNGHLNPERSIAIVGTRKATEYGKSITDKIVADLRDFNVTVISGLAYGIDIQAHKACLKNQLPTCAVLAGGLDRIYPSVHKKYAEEMLENGGIISESIPGTKPDPHLFPARNRIIAGMSDATIIVEAAEKGGALITAHIADSYDKPVFAVPGDIGHTYSEGTNKLIATQRALIYTGVEDLLVHLQWDVDSRQSPPKPLPELSEGESAIYHLLQSNGSPMEIDLISIQTQIPINRVASHLLSLEFKNLIKSLPGKKFGLI